MLLRRRVFEPQMPEPRIRVLSEHESERVLDAEPRARPNQLPVRHGGLESRAAGRAQQRRPFQRLTMAPQVEVGRPAFHLVAEEQANAHSAAVEAANGTVGVDFDAEARAIGNTLREKGRGLVCHVGQYRCRGRRIERGRHGTFVRLRTHRCRHYQFHGRIQRQARCAEGCAGVVAAMPEHFVETAPMRHRERAAADTSRALLTVPSTRVSVISRSNPPSAASICASTLRAGDAGRFAALILGQLCADATLIRQRAVDQRDLPGNEEQSIREDPWLVAAGGPRGCG